MMAAQKEGGKKSSGPAMDARKEMSKTKEQVGGRLSYFSLLFTNCSGWGGDEDLLENPHQAPGAGQHGLGRAEAEGSEDLWHNSPARDRQVRLWAEAAWPGETISHLPMLFHLLILFRITSWRSWRRGRSCSRGTRPSRRVSTPSHSPRSTPQPSGRGGQCSVLSTMQCFNDAMFSNS